MANNKKFDFAVIGAGSGGLAAARRAASFGKSVILFDPNRLGGTCVNLGCIPKKMMWYAANLSYQITHLAPYYGFSGLSSSSFDWIKFVENRNASVAELNERFQKTLELANICLVRKKATLFQKDSEVFIKTTDKTVYQAEEYLLATGSYPIAPKNLSAAALALVKYSDYLFSLKNQPRRVLLVGAGYIGVEFAFMLQSLGTEVFFAIRNERVLCRADTFAQEAVTEALEKSGVKVLKGSVVSDIVKKSTQEALVVASGLSEKFEKNKELLKDVSNVEITEESLLIQGLDFVLYAIGRKPDLSFLDESSTIAKDVIGKGKLEVSASYLVPQFGSNVWAVGDVSGLVQLTPVAIKQGRLLADKLFGPSQEREFDPVDLSSVPTVVFSHPPTGEVGLTEQKAIEQYGADAISSKKMKFDGLLYNIPKKVGISKNHILGNRIKIVYLKENQKVLGIHLFGEFAAEALQGFAVSLSMGATLKDLKETIAIHPTSAEEVVLI